MSNYFVGKEHTELSNWLRQTWLKEGPPVHFIEGFSGVGKTFMARNVAQNSGWLKPVMVNMPEANGDQADNLFLELATELSQIGNDDMANAVTEGKSFELTLESVLNQPILIIVDEFQRALVDGPFTRFLERIANRPKILGRVLILTNRIVEQSRWSEAFTIHRLSGLSLIDAESLLERLLNKAGRSQEVPQKRRRDVVKWLGCNPRAIHILVASLEKSSLDDLIGISREIWDARDRDVSAELLHLLETELLKRIIEHLKPGTTTLLRRLSVHRKSVKQEAIDMLLPENAEFVDVRNDLISRFLIEQHTGWFSLNPVVREISLQKIKEKAGEFKQAHSCAANFYMRHFLAKNIVESGKLGGYFVEARYHLVQSQRDAELISIAGRFENHLKARFSSVSPIPRQLDELNERIATLRALLETPGSKGIEYYLARLYEARGAEGDWQKALHYAQRATGPRAPVCSWLLRVQLEAKVNGPEKLLSVVREGIAKIPADKNLYSLYQSAGELLAQADKREEAISLLKEGIAKISADHGVVSLYQSAGELLAQADKQEEAISLLKEGIAKISADHGVVSLYQSAGELLAQADKREEAISLLKEGITKIPADHGAVSLYQSAGELLAQANKREEAILLLKEGITKIPADYYVVLLYQITGKLLAQAGKSEEAIELLKKGIGCFPFEEGTRYKLTEPILNMLLAQQNIQAIDDFLTGMGTLVIDRPQVAYGKVLRLIIMRKWELAAQTAQQENANFPHYRPLIQNEVFCWLCANNLNAAKNALQQLQVKSKPGNSLNWLKTWIALKDGDLNAASDSLSTFLNRPADDQEVNEHFLLRLWDTPPTDFHQTDLAYYFPILPAAITGLYQNVI